MIGMIKYVFFMSLMSALLAITAHANTYTAATCNTSDVTAAISKAAEGDTVVIPPGTCTWTSGVSVSGKGINIQGGGSGRVIGISVVSTAISLGTGTKTFSNLIAASAAGVISGNQPTVTNGETLRIIELGFLANFMEGTVSSFSSGTLTMNITNAGGTCGTSTPSEMNSNCKRWLITTLPSTVLVNDLSSGAMFSVDEDTSFHTSISGIHFSQGASSAGSVVSFNWVNGGQAILFHDNFVEQPQNAEGISSNTNRGVIWNNSFMESPFQLSYSALRILNNDITELPSWTTPSTMGAADTTGQNNLYVEANDFHAYGAVTDLDSNSKAVLRYNVLNNSSSSTHGPDTSTEGFRHFEFYNNAGIFNAYSDGSTANMNWWYFVRGGTFAFFNNTLPVISSQDWGSKGDLNMTVMNLNRAAGPNPCWGYNTSGGADYHSPRQVGMGYVTGTGKDGLGRTADLYTYVGDSEPAYIWGNSRSPLNISITDYPNGAQNSCTGGTPDVSANYIVLNRDYFNGSAAKPGYTPFTYPHPLTLGKSSGASSAATTPAAPTNLSATVQ